jgi:hypothetical protein
MLGKKNNSWFQVYMGFTTIVRLVDKKNIARHYAA